MKKQILKVCPISEFGFGDYQYFVETPENDYMYFRTKREAKDFIEFYHEYQKKQSVKNFVNIE